ncbi:MAG: hypothetical protein J0M15_03750 [Deltaproteobacteria bacterium]|nr:hypothetical protein [Deltaproteobacteria bacterium]
MLQFIMVYSFVFLAAFSAKADEKGKDRSVVKNKCKIVNAHMKIENYEGSEITYTEVVYSCERETKKINCHGKEPINLELCMKKPFSLEEWHKRKDEKLLKKMEENQKFNREIHGPSR